MNWKKSVRCFLFPHPLLTALLSAAAAALLAYGFIAFETTDVLSIVSYVLAFYALVLLCLRVPDMIVFAQRIRRENKYYRLYKSDARLRMNISLYGSFAYNAAYALFQLCLGFKHHSVWFYAMAGYYLLLAGMRMILARTINDRALRKQRTVQWRRYRLCGCLLLVMNIALLIFILYFVFRIRIFRHHEITTIAMAAYTFSALAVAIRNAVRCRKFGSPAYSAAKAISLVSAVVSMLALENGMLNTFGEANGELFRQVILGISGIAVILLVQGIAVYMIRNAAKHLRINDSQT